MGKKRLGMCIQNWENMNAEYADRCVNYLMRHKEYPFVPVVFEEIEQYLSRTDLLCDLIILFGDPEDSEQLAEVPVPVICVTDHQNPDVGRHAVIVEKYQDITGLFSRSMEMLGMGGGKAETGAFQQGTIISAVYSLSAPALQLPLAFTMASVLGESERVLILDLQENSGIKRLLDQDFESGSGLEDLLILAEQKSEEDISAYIGVLKLGSFVYPARNEDTLQEMNAAMLKSLIEYLSERSSFNRIIINLGGRFEGFWDFLPVVQEFYLARGKEGHTSWREQEFYRECMENGHGDFIDSVTEVFLTTAGNTATSPEKLAETWIWGNLGDVIRSGRWEQGVSAQNSFR